MKGNREKAKAERWVRHGYTLSMTPEDLEVEKKYAGRFFTEIDVICLYL